MNIRVYKDARSLYKTTPVAHTGLRLPLLGRPPRQQAKLETGNSVVEKQHGLPATPRQQAKLETGN